MPRSLAVVFVLFIGFAGALVAQTKEEFGHSLASIPNPQTTRGGYVSDPDGLLAAAELEQLDSLLIGLENELGVEYAVVIVRSIGPESPRGFATELFNRWGIGKAGVDNGLLLLVVLDQRRWEFETGYGLEGVLTDVQLSQIGRNTLPPYFREARYGAGLIDACKQVIAVLQANKAELSMSPAERAAAREAREAQERRALAEAESESLIGFFAIAGVLTVLYLAFALWRRRAIHKNYAQWRQKHSGDNTVEGLQTAPMPLPLWLGLALFWPALLILIAYGALFGAHFRSTIGPPENLSWIGSLSAYVMFALQIFVHRVRKAALLLRANSEPYLAYSRLRDYNKGLWIGILLAPFLYIPYYLFSRARLRTLRLKPRICPKCQTAMHRLGEKEDDPHLEKGQRTEESIASVDYDVWICPKDSEVLIHRYELSSRYSQCENCSYITSRVVRSYTVRSPTYESAGQGAQEHKCEHCGREKTTTYSIAKLVRSTSSSSGGRSSSSGSFSSGSRSSGSFGGGRSGGGGAGGSW